MVFFRRSDPDKFSPHESTKALVLSQGLDPDPVVVSRIRSGYSLFFLIRIRPMWTRIRSMWTQIRSMWTRIHTPELPTLVLSPPLGSLGKYFMPGSLKSELFQFQKFITAICVPLLRSPTEILSVPNTVSYNFFSLTI